MSADQLRDDLTTVFQGFENIFVVGDVVNTLEPRLGGSAVDQYAEMIDVTTDSTNIIPDTRTAEDVELAVIRPEAGTFDDTEAVFYYSSHANPLHPHLLYGLGLSAEVLGAQIFAFGSHGVGNTVSPIRDRGHRAGVANNGHLKPVVRNDVEAVEKIVEAYDLDNIIVTGYSKGAMIAPLIALHAKNSPISGFGSIEAPNVVDRRGDNNSPLGSLIATATDLAPAFFASDKSMQRAVKTAVEHLPDLKELRPSNSFLVKYLASLVLPTNVTIARAIARGTYVDDVSRALNARPELVATDIHGLDSELVDVDDAQELLVDLAGYEDRFRLDMVNHGHGMADNPFVMAGLLRLAQRNIQNLQQDRS